MHAFFASYFEIFSHSIDSYKPLFNFRAKHECCFQIIFNTISSNDKDAKFFISFHKIKKNIFLSISNVQLRLFFFKNIIVLYFFLNNPSNPICRFSIIMKTMQELLKTKIFCSNRQVHFHVTELNIEKIKITKLYLYNSTYL